jgi:5-methylcytosine-specific restriction endonuclease McrA
MSNLISNLIYGDDRRRRTVTPGEKNYYLRMARGKCEYCGKDIIGKGIVPEIHHIVPVASRGSDMGHNLIVLCPDCHSRVESISKEALRGKIAYRLPKKATAEKVKDKATRKKTSTAKPLSKKSNIAKTTKKKTSPSKTKIKKVTSSKSVIKKAATSSTKNEPKSRTRASTR